MIFFRAIHRQIEANKGKIFKKIGIDEISMRKGKREYIVIITDLSRGCVIGVLEVRSKDKVKEWAGLNTSHTHLIVSGDLLKTVEDLVNNLEKDQNYKISAENIVKSASFKFYYQAFNKDDGANLKEYFEGLPKSLTIKDYSPKEEIYEDSKGVEVYAPLHSYQITASGVVQGPFLDVLKAHQV